jgi:thymidine phosphorylase
VLALSLVATGELAGVRTEALITDMEAPLGRAVGNALEIVESIETLKGRGARRTSSRSRWSSRRACSSSPGGGRSRARDRAAVRAALASGAGVEKFREIIANQGGDPR